jgi:hypothetical protein
MLKNLIEKGSVTLEDLKNIDIDPETGKRKRQIERPISQKRLTTNASAKIL